MIRRLLMFPRLLFFGGPLPPEAEGTTPEPRQRGERFGHIKATIADLEEKAQFAERQMDTARARELRARKAECEELLERVEQAVREADERRRRLMEGWERSEEELRREQEAMRLNDMWQFPRGGVLTPETERSLAAFFGNALTVMLVILIVLMLAALLPQ